MHGLLLRHFWSIFLEVLPVPVPGCPFPEKMCFGNFYEHKYCYCPSDFSISHLIYVPSNNLYSFFQKLIQNEPLTERSPVSFFLPSRIASPPSVLCCCSQHPQHTGRKVAANHLLSSFLYPPLLTPLPRPPFS
jgi:hypothetical protein